MNAGADPTIEADNGKYDREIIIRSGIIIMNHNIDLL